MKNEQSEEGIRDAGSRSPAFLAVLCWALFVFSSVACGLNLTDEEIRTTQFHLRDRSLGERIAFWAEKFVGTPYDPDPVGEYVSKSAVVADERVDCMYLVYRSIELAMSTSPEEAIEIALDKRFHSRGRLEKGAVANYEDRFQSGEEMISSGKWGREITEQLGRTVKVQGQAAWDRVDVLPPDQLLKALERLKTGDIIFFVKAPAKRRAGEIVGHLGIITVEQRPDNRGREEVLLIHAGGIKTRGGMVRKVLLKDYLTQTSFLGAKVTRFS